MNVRFLFAILSLLFGGMLAFSPTIARGRSNHRQILVMGNNARFGIFSPVVYAAKLVLGETKLNKV
jgi:Na+-transporting methylmalonyl-CoA/oxaloacetate decarboxylase beta subunit